MTLKELHAAIQAAMGWENSHLYQFHVGRETIAGPGMDGAGWGASPSIGGAGRVRLADLTTRGGKRFFYVSHMGDSWEHTIHIDRSPPTDPAASYPRLVDGALRYPPEDIGGIPGFYAFLTQWAIPSIQTMTTE